MTLFRAGDPCHIHLMGIGGAGMSALAILARHRGVAITGCDADDTGKGFDGLTALGIPVWRGHDPRHVEGARAIVVTAAISRDHPELEKARALGHPVVRRADALGELVAGGKEGVVAVAGTHGKTTTTVMVTEALTAAGRNPTGLAGGRVAAWGGNARIGGEDLYVVEADEYDKAFLSLRPTVAVVNNVEADHLECYGSIEALEDAFAEFAGRASRVIVGGDDAGADRVALRVSAPAWRVGQGATADVRIRAVRLARGKALAGADVVVVAPIYAAREQPQPGVTHHLVVRGATRAGAATVGVRDRAGLTTHVARAVREGDVVFTLGAGDITRIGPELLGILGRGAAGASTGEQGAVA